VWAAAAAPAAAAGQQAAARQWYLLLLVMVANKIIVSAGVDLVVSPRHGLGELCPAVLCQRSTAADVPAAAK